MRQKDQITLIIATLWTPLRHPGWESLFHSIIRSKQFNNKNQTTFIILTLLTYLENKSKICLRYFEIFV